jgi:hypothetical protein
MRMLVYKHVYGGNTSLSIDENRFNKLEISSRTNMGELVKDKKFKDLTNAILMLCYISIPLFKYTDFVRPTL